MRGWHTFLRGLLLCTPASLGVNQAVRELELRAPQAGPQLRAVTCRGEASTKATSVWQSREASRLREIPPYTFGAQAGPEATQAMHRASPARLECPDEPTDLGNHTLNPRAEPLSPQDRDDHQGQPKTMDPQVTLPKKEAPSWGHHRGVSHPVQGQSSAPEPTSRISSASQFYEWHPHVGPSASREQRCSTCPGSLCSGTALQ